MFEVTEEIMGKYLKKIRDCMIGGDEVKQDKEKIKNLTEMKLNLDCRYVGTKNRVGLLIAAYKKSEDYKNAGTNNDQREAWLELQIKSEAEQVKLEEYNFYWRAIREVERYNNIVLALDGRMILDEKIGYINGKR